MKYTIQNKLQRGFTLLEVITTIILISFISVSTVLFFSTLQTGQVATMKRLKMIEAMENAMVNIETHYIQLLAGIDPTDRDAQILDNLQNYIYGNFGYGNSDEQPFEVSTNSLMLLQGMKLDENIKMVEEGLRGYSNYWGNDYMVVTIKGAQIGNDPYSQRPVISAAFFEKNGELAAYHAILGGEL